MQRFRLGGQYLLLNLIVLVIQITNKHILKQCQVQAPLPISKTFDRVQHGLTVILNQTTIDRLYHRDFYEEMGAKEVILGTCLWFLFVLLVILPLGFLALWKGIIILVAKCFRRDLRVLSPIDILQSPGPTDVKPIVNFGLVCKVQGRLSLENLQMRFAEKFLDQQDSVKLKYEKLHSYIVTFGGYAFAKVVDRIEINEQISIRSLKEEQLLEDLLSEWLLTKYKEHAPCWEMILVHLKDTNETALAFKIHHAFADGYSVLYILDELTDNTSPYLVKDFEETWCQKTLQMIEAPCYMKKLLGSPETNPFPVAKELPHGWTLAFTTLNLPLLKALRRKHNVHFSSLILSLLGGALRRYLLETRAAEELSNLPESLIMGTTLAWPNHPSKNPSTELKEKLCNHWVAGIVKVPISGEGPIERLLETEKSFAEFVGLGLHKFIKRFMELITWPFWAKLVEGMFAKDSGFSGGYSTMVGGNNYRLLGKEVSEIYPLLAIHDENVFIPLSVFTFSHSDKLDVTLAVNPQHFPTRRSLERLLKDHFTNELTKLCVLSGLNIETDAGQITIVS